MEDWQEFNRRIEEKYLGLGADRLRIQRLIEKENLPADTTHRLAELRREIDITMTGGWG